MSNLYMKQKVFSWGDKFEIWDESGNLKYNVQGEVFSFGKKLHIYNSFGDEVAFIHQKVFTFLPRYYIDLPNIGTLEIVKEFTILKQRYRIEGLPWRLEGDFFAHDYNLFGANGEIAMSLDKKWLTWGDCYEMNILDDANELLCLCITLAVDAATAQSGSHVHNN